MNYNYIEKEVLNESEIEGITKLEKLCYDYDKTNVKLELEYKKMCLHDNNGKGLINEFLCFDKGSIIGYIGVCDFGGDVIEINGLVDPNYRGQGLFKELYRRCMSSVNQRDSKLKLLLTDSKSKEGIGFVNRVTNDLHHSEYEMYLDDSFVQDENLCDIELRLATNKDAYEIDLQNKIYFKDESDGDEINLKLINPEDEIEKGFFIYLAINDKNIVGKVNIQYNDEISGIYGLGVKPEYRSKGLGRSILRKSIEKIQEHGDSKVMLQVEVENDNALNLYKSCGFKVTYSMNYYNL